MGESTEDLIADARDGISTYTNGFSGDIGQRFKRVDARLERASEALESETDDTDDVRDHLQDAKQDLRSVVKSCFTGVTPGNFEQYVEQPLDRALESVN